MELEELVLFLQTKKMEMEQKLENMQKIVYENYQSFLQLFPFYKEIAYRYMEDMLPLILELQCLGEGLVCLYQHVPFLRIEEIQSLYSQMKSQNEVCLESIFIKQKQYKQVSCTHHLEYIESADASFLKTIDWKQEIIQKAFPCDTALRYLFENHLVTEPFLVYLKQHTIETQNTPLVKPVLEEGIVKSFHVFMTKEDIFVKAPRKIDVYLAAYTYYTYLGLPLPISLQEKKLTFEESQTEFCKQLVLQGLSQNPFLQNEF